MLRTIFTAGMLLIAAQPAMADSEIAIRSAVFVEQGEPGAARTIERASVLSRGQRVVTVLNWQAPASRAPFTVTTRVPVALSFERSSSGSEEISTDGGRSWGKLGHLRLHDAYGWRLAGPEDITHLRWRMNGKQQAGHITYSAWVR